MTDQLVRHSIADRVMHWFNCVCWILLFFTGMALLMSPAPFGSGYSKALRFLAGGQDNLFLFHIGVGIAWCCGALLYVFIHPRGAVSFFKEIFCLKKGDGSWILRKPFLMVLGKKRTEKLGLPGELPAQGFYNIGQKAFGSLALTGCVVLAITGVYMAAAAFGCLSGELQSTLQLFILIHFIAAALVFLGLLIHVYMAAISPDERPGFWSMFSGTVSRHYAEHHHGLWVKNYEE